MQLTIHDAELRKVAFVDNDKNGTLNFFNAKFKRSLATASATFEFSVFKKTIQPFLRVLNPYQVLNERAFVSFRYKGEDFLFNVISTKESEQVIECSCENLNYELITELTNPYKSDRARTFQEYCDLFGITGMVSLLKIGVNEVSHLSRKLEWEGTDTKLTRLLSLAHKFDAEIAFVTLLNDDSTVKEFKVNVYREHDEQHQGVGKRRDELMLRYGKNITGITRKIDKDAIFNKIHPVGRGENNSVVTIGGMGKWEEKNKQGEVEFYQDGEFLCAPLSKQLYPAVFNSDATRDQWIYKDYPVESADKSVIRAAGIKELKRTAYPAISYEILGETDANLGDTVLVYDDGFDPTLYLEVRVTEQEIYLDNPAANKTTFGNVRALENKLSTDIQRELEKALEQAQPYNIRLTTDKGLIFKANKGQSVVTPTLLKGDKTVTCGWKWQVDGNDFPVAPTFTVDATNMSDKLVLTAIAVIDGKEIAREQLTFANVRDGVKGDKGDPGPKGDKGTFEGEIGGRNLLLNSSFSDNSSTNHSFTVNGKVYNVRNMRHWNSPYNTGLPNYRNIFHAFLTNGVIEFNETNGGRNWKAIAQDVKDRITESGTYYFSADMKPSVAKMKAWGGFYYYNKQGVRDFHAKQVDIFTDTANQWKRYGVAMRLGDDVDFTKPIVCYLYCFNFSGNHVLWLKNPKLEKGTIGTAYTEAPEDIQQEITTVKTNLTNTTEQISQSVTALGESVVKKSDITINENGIISTVEKTVNGQTLATAIAQSSENVDIIAKLLKVKSDMIVDGAITADKLNVKELSALSSNLGSVRAGYIFLNKQYKNTGSVDTWGVIPNVSYDVGLIVSDDGILTNGRVARQHKDDPKPTVMPITYMTAGEIYFAHTSSDYDLRQIELNGVYPFTSSGSGKITFGKMENGKDALYIDGFNCDIYLRGNNYTDWKQSEVNDKVRWKVQGNLVLVDYDIRFSNGGKKHIATIPSQYVPGARMLTATAWSFDRSKHRNAQLEPDGKLYILEAEKDMPYNGQIIWTY